MKEKFIGTSLTLLWRDLAVDTLTLSQQETREVKAHESPYPSVISDEQLAARLSGRDPEALSLIYDRYAASIYRVLSALLNSPADAEDALQEVFVTLATGRLSKIRDLRSYLFMAARNQALTLIRRRQKEQGWENVDELEIAAPAPDEAPHDWTLLLCCLPLEQREVIVLKVWEQMTFAEIALVVGASPNTVMSRYRYGIERLRAWCREEGAHD